ncbi:MAG: response regulator [Verrucomicrobiales bacterium]|nr:response regulator [Verrucomicrobiales bacterium]
MPDQPSARILIVDDEQAQMRALCDTLHDEGFEVVGFSAARDALAALKETKFDLLLADLMMPEMDGIALLRQALEMDANLVGIIMTGQGTIDTAVGAMKTGALDYILKPFKLSAILPVLSRALTVRRLRMEKAVLEQHVRERTLALEAANKELDAFAHSVSHDLHAPVRAMREYSKILLKDNESQLSERDQHLLRHIRDSAQEMTQLIEGLFRFSRLGRQPLTRQEFDVSALVKDVLAELARQQPDRRVEFQMSELGHCVGDRQLLKQVFVNLLSNAFKFTAGKEEARVEIGFQRAQNEVVYYVRDNGAGFDMRYAQKLFRIFQRLHSDAEFEGTGIGLSLVQRIIQRHGGRVWAEGEVGKGATFFFTLTHSPPAA